MSYFNCLTYFPRHGRRERITGKWVKARFYCLCNWERSVCQRNQIKHDPAWKKYEGVCFARPHKSISTKYYLTCKDFHSEARTGLFFCELQTTGTDYGKLPLNVRYGGWGCLDGLTVQNSRCYSAWEKLCRFGFNAKHHGRKTNFWNLAQNLVYLSCWQQRENFNWGCLKEKWREENKELQKYRKKEGKGNRRGNIMVFSHQLLNVSLGNNFFWH